MSDTRQPEPTVRSAAEHTLMPSEVTEHEDTQPGHVRCIIVTPERAVLDETAEMVILPMFDGEFGVLQGRAPLGRTPRRGRIAAQDRRGVEAVVRRRRLRAGPRERRHGPDRQRPPGDRDHTHDGR